MHAFTSASTRSPPRFTPKQCSIVRIHSWETSARRAALGEQGQGLPNPGGCHIRVPHDGEPLLQSAGPVILLLHMPCTLCNSNSLREATVPPC